MSLTLFDLSLRHMKETTLELGLGWGEDELTSKNKAARSSTFSKSMSEPIHRWFRYSAGFSSEWVRETIFASHAQQIFDPFAGSGTVLLEADFLGRKSIGLEAHPFVERIARTKLDWQIDVDQFKLECQELLRKADNVNNENSDSEHDLLKRCYSPENLDYLVALRETYLHDFVESRYGNHIWLLLTSILRITSGVGTAQWQYLLPAKSKRKVLHPRTAFIDKMNMMINDIRLVQEIPSAKMQSLVLLSDAREMSHVPSEWADLVITSPPYANNYDYADATRLELTFWKEIDAYSDLQTKIRTNLVRACTQHVNAKRFDISVLRTVPELSSIIVELEDVYEKLYEIKFKKSGKKNYDVMVALYFYDMALVLKQLRRVTKKDGKMCFVIGDSAPYGIYVPVDKWFSQIAISLGFTSCAFEQTRARNVKWKNRKHTVPLKEGRLWIS